MASSLVKFLTKTAGSAAQSLIAGEIKRHAKGYIEKLTNRTEDSIRWEVRRRLGYDSEQYTVNAKQEVVFKSSAMLMHEWLCNAPEHTGKVTKDEENGAIYYDGAQLSNWFKTNLIAKFQKATGTNSPAAPGHFDKALDLMEPSDFTAKQFKEELSGWDGKPVIDTFLQNCFRDGLETDEKYAVMLFRKWMIGTAKRAMHPGETLDGCLVLQGPAGVGKCLGRGTPVLMFDGSIKFVEDIVVGDILMGPDSKPRQVLALGSGEEEMYKIIPNKGKSFTCNASHILPLKVFNKKKGKRVYTEITVKDFLVRGKSFQRNSVMYRTGVDFQAKAVPLDPYFFGLWLGDGDKDGPVITTADDEIVKYLTQYAEDTGNFITKYTTKDKCPRYSISSRVGSGRSVSDILGIKSVLRQLNVLNNKHIPAIYKQNSKEVRLQLLAGLIDADGSISNSCYDFVSEFEHIAQDVVYLAQSVGLFAKMSFCKKSCQDGFTGNYFRVTISGHTNIIPVKLFRKKASARNQIKDVLHTGFRVENIGIGEYFGFQIDGDGLFLLGDFTVTHNTQFFRQLLPGSFERRSGEIYADVKSPQRFVEAIVGKTIATFDELSVLDYEKSDEIFKQLLSSQNIDVRMAWARKVRRYALRQGFAGTKNPPKFIRDKFLSRRLWVIQLNANQRLDFEFLHLNKEALWKEAVYLAEKGESCILSSAEQAEVEEHNRRHWI